MKILKGTCRICSETLTLDEDGNWRHHGLGGFVAHVQAGLWDAAKKTQDAYALAGPSKGIAT